MFGGKNRSDTKILQLRIHAFNGLPAFVNNTVHGRGQYGSRSRAIRLTDAGKHRYTEKVTRKSWIKTTIKAMGRNGSQVQNRFIALVE